MMPGYTTGTWTPLVRMKRRVTVRTKVLEYDKFSLRLTKKDAEQGFHSGSCDHDINMLMSIPRIKKQLDAIDNSILFEYVQSCGTGLDADASTDTIQSYMLWIACGDYIEGAI